MLIVRHWNSVINLAKNRKVVIQEPNNWRLYRIRRELLGHTADHKPSSSLAVSIKPTFRINEIYCGNNREWIWSAKIRYFNVFSLTAWIATDGHWISQLASHMFLKYIYAKENLSLETINVGFA